MGPPFVKYSRRGDIVVAMSGARSARRSPNEFFCCRELPRSCRGTVGRQARVYDWPRLLSNLNKSNLRCCAHDWLSVSQKTARALPNLSQPDNYVPKELNESVCYCSGAFDVARSGYQLAYFWHGAQNRRACALLPSSDLARAIATRPHAVQMPS